MRISAREACVKPHLRTRSDIKVTDVILLLPAGVKVTFIFAFTRGNIIDGEQKFTHKFHSRNDAVVVSLWVFILDCSKSFESGNENTFFFLVKSLLLLSIISHKIFPIWSNGLPTCLSHHGSDFLQGLQNTPLRRLLMCHGCLWVSMRFWVYVGVYGCLWVFRNVYGYLWAFMSFKGVDGYIWVSMGFCESRVFMGVMGIYGCLWDSMDVYGYLCVSMGVMGVYGYS